ncbi:hypothetical protein V5N11_032719 [Cardamine amara subsp. amara]|uniref:Zinc knuckle CX2CX4HX4C domain-containing protein n=1 Tax=Cardamine amara subsp. amara TaxID=228776 RepID=A0ABD1BVM6_CARAN
MVLEKGVHTYNEWTIVMERWVEHPPPDYLQHILVWVQLRNIPVNHYNVPAITWFGELVGQVKEVLLDTEKTQRQDFVRVKLKFDVSKPLQRAKVVNLPKNGGAVTILFDFERVQKRCFTCQRLTHDQRVCPVAQKRKQLREEEDKIKASGVEAPKKKLILETDPLFGILEDHQIESCPISGKPKIDATVVEGMRHYLLMVEGVERIVRAERIKSSLESLKNDPIGQKTLLWLEPAPVVSSDINKGKGIVFDYGVKNIKDSLRVGVESEGPLLRDEFRAERESQRDLVGIKIQSKGVFERLGEHIVLSVEESNMGQGSSTVQRTCIFQACSSSGTSLIKNYRRKRPSKSQRKKGGAKALGGEGKQMDIEIGRVMKRKAEEEATIPSKVAKRTTKEMVPNEGPSNA